MVHGDHLGRTRTKQGQQAVALEYFEQSAAIYHEQGDRYGQADSLSGLGTSLEALGDHECARPQLQAALAIFEEMQTPEAEEVRGCWPQPV